ncbi:MAG: hypothetical protein EPN91_06185 [Salinibacterium sp.]|nr:MAG: hypothetical protein EPN91_06185 [Salinibacterium sp.]
MYFSEAFSVERGPDDDWFDRLLESDTQLFVDPFLVFAETDGLWADGGERLSGHFQRGFEILAGHQDNPESLQYRKTVDLMVFPEPKEFGLGFVGVGTDGSGTGRGFAKRIVSAMAIAIEKGLQDLRRFEELGVLVEKIGRDRISDITCNILKYKFIEYTQEVCRRHNIPLVDFKVESATVDPLRKRWASQTVGLPENPKNGKPVLLTPARFLRELPTLNADDWWDFVEPTLRDDLNLELVGRLRKADIVFLARQHTDLVRAWTESRANDPAEPYDVEKDPAGLHLWQMETRGIASESPLTMGDVGPNELGVFVAEVNEHFKHFVEARAGWRLLRTEDTFAPRREASVQLLYRGVVESYCHAHGVRLDREVDVGKGPVDFVFTTSTQRVLLEIKKVGNGKFWNGLEQQLVSYITSEQCAQGWLLAVQFSSTRTETARVRDLPARARAASASSGFDLHTLVVDARVRLSASEITEDESTAEGADDPEFDDV